MEKKSIDVTGEIIGLHIVTINISCPYSHTAQKKFLKFLKFLHNFYLENVSKCQIFIRKSYICDIPVEIYFLMDNF